MMASTKVWSKASNTLRIWNITKLFQLVLKIVLYICISEKEILSQDLQSTEKLSVHDVKRFWGVPDTVAAVGRIFKCSIPLDSFSGHIEHFEVSKAGENHLPLWLNFDPINNTFFGVPTEQDLGQHYISVKAYGILYNSSIHTVAAKDVFSIEVLEDPVELLSQSNIEILKCPVGQSPTIAAIAFDVDIEDLNPVKRINLLSKMSVLIKLPVDALKLISVGPDDQVFDESAIMAGAGNVKIRQHSGVIVQWQVGCSGNINHDQILYLSDIEKTAKNGSLSEIFSLPLIGWHVSTLHPHFSREKRQLWYTHATPVLGILPTQLTHITERIDIEPTEESIIPETRIIPTMASPVFSSSYSHHHRHHHSDRIRGYNREKDTLPTTVLSTIHFQHISASPIAIATPLFVPEKPTKYIAVSSVDPYGRNYPNEFTPVDALMSSMTMPINKITVTEILPSRTYIVTTNILTSEIKPTKTEMTTDSTKRPPSIPNFKPTINSRMRKLSMIAGKVWSYRIPRDTFTDMEDGDTRNLKLIFMTAEHTAIPSSSWIQFDPEKQMLYALPLEENIGKYEFILEAMDSEGASTFDKLEIHVWQHQSARAVNHEFSMTLKLNKWEFPIAVDWQIEIVRRLANFYKDKNESFITVQVVSTDPFMITWTNDSLPAYPCPREQISQLMSKLFIGGNGEVSRQLKKSMGPEFRVQDATVNFLGVCQSPASTTSSTHTNFAPMLRNAIEQINTTVGEILRFKVPDDTFYDFEDGSTRYLSLTFLMIDNIQPPKSSWVQFNPKSQELYGLPFESDAGRHEFQMVAVDSDGLQVNDAFVIIVQPRQSKKWSVEFSLHLDLSYDEFSRDIAKKVLVAWKLAKLYGDFDPRYITVSSISKGSVVYAWTNNTLPHDPCPKEKISQLVKYLFNENGTISSRLTEALNPEFKIIKADAMPLGICLDKVTPTSVTVTPPPSTEESPPIASSDDDIYISTIIPAVVIAVMLIVATMIACFLYRKKRKDKMATQDNSTFISKGIPIIFADELEEKPDPAKAPIIMKDEKPPLLAPEYLRSSISSRDSTPQMERHEPSHLQDTNADLHPDPNSSPPYQPPPPFTANRDNKNSRPKATPTYRQPPPYVPP